MGKIEENIAMLLGHDREYLDSFEQELLIARDTSSGFVFMGIDLLLEFSSTSLLIKRLCWGH